MKAKLEKFFDTLFPPGYDRQKELRLLFVYLLMGIIFSFRCITEYYEAYDGLFVWRSENGFGIEKVVRQGAQIVPFGEIVGYNFMMLWLVVFLLITTPVKHYLYYTKGSKSIYLVRRLPDKRYVWKTCVLGPLIGMGITLAIIGFLRLVYWLIYIGVTPAECLPG